MLELAVPTDPYQFVLLCVGAGWLLLISGIAAFSLVCACLDNGDVYLPIKKPFSQEKKE